MPTYFKHEKNCDRELKYKQFVASYICWFPDLFVRVWRYLFSANIKECSERMSELVENVHVWE